MKTIIFLSLAFIATQSFAQNDSTTTENWSFANSQKIIKVTPFDVINSTSMLGADLEFTYSEDVSFQLGAAILPSYLQSSVGSDIGDFNRLTGYNLRGESRFYIFKKPTRYLAAGVSFRHIVIKSDVPVGMEAVSSNPQLQQDFSYFVNTPMRFHRFNTELSIKWGFQRTFATNFVFDFYVGLGIKKVNVQSFSKIPEGGIVPIDWSNDFTLVDNFRDAQMSPVIGFKLGYKLKN